MQNLAGWGTGLSALGAQGQLTPCGAHGHDYSIETDVDTGQSPCGTEMRRVLRVMCRKCGSLVDLTKVAA